GGELPAPPLERYQASVTADQLVYDGGRIGSRIAVEGARLAELEAEIAAALYPLRQEVNEAYFGALRLQVRAAEAALLMEELEARLTEARARVREGASLPSDTAALEVERLRARLALDEAESERDAAL